MVELFVKVLNTMLLFQQKNRYYGTAKYLYNEFDAFIS